MKVVTIGHFTVESGGKIPGHLVVRPRQAATQLAELSVEALEAMGPLFARGMSAIQAVVKPERIYILRFGEEIEAIHFHLFPRTIGMAKAYHALHPDLPMASGAQFFEWARRPDILSRLTHPLTAEQAFEAIVSRISRDDTSSRDMRGG